MQRYKALFNLELPVVAREQKWPVRLNHCLMRVALDHHCGRCWYEVLDRKMGALKSLSIADIEAVIALGERMRSQGRNFVVALNRRSLDLRGKRGPAGGRS